MQFSLCFEWVIKRRLLKWSLDHPITTTTTTTSTTTTTTTNNNHDTHNDNHNDNDTDNDYANINNQIVDRFSGLEIREQKGIGVYVKDLQKQCKQ